MIPSPIQPARSAIALLSVSAPAGGLESQALVGVERAGGLGVDRLVVDEVAPAFAVAAAGGAAGRVAAALGQQRPGHPVPERLHLAHDAVAAAVLARAARVAPDGVLDDPQRELELERL